MESLKNSNFGLFFTYGISLSLWEKIGIIDREIKPYQKLADNFKEVFLFTYGKNEHKKYSHLFPDNVHIVSKPKFIPNIIYSVIMPVIHFNKFRKIKLLKTNQMKGSWTAVFSKKLFNSKLIIRCGYEWLKTLEKTKKSLKKKVAYFLEKSAYKNADKLIFTSKEGADFVIKKFSISPEKIEIISNYIDTKLFRPLPIEKKGNRIVFVGRLEKEKNLSNLIISLEGIEAELVLIGEGPMRAELEKLSREKKVITIFKGNLKQKDLPEELNKSSIFILPSLFEGNPKALLEAMSCGLACIGTNVDGISGIIDNGNSGILSFSDSDSLKKAIIVLLENKELRDKLGINARKAIERNNDFDVLFGKELALYLNILS